MMTITHDSYRKIAEASMDWISENLQNFNFRAENSLNLIAQLKPLAELALASEIGLSNPHLHPKAKEKTKEWLKHCWVQLRDGEALRRAIETRKDFLLFAAMYVPFHRNDLMNEDLEEAVRKRLQSSAHPLEFPPWILLLMVRSLKALNIPSPWKIEDCFRRTWLYGLPEVAALHGMRGYELTHIVFFLTDFGRRFQDLPGIHRHYLMLRLPRWMQSSRSAKHYDMLAELVMTARCIRMSDQQDWGSVLLQGLHSKEGRFRDHYHSVLSAFMAGVMSSNDASMAAPVETALDPTS